MFRLQLARWPILDSMRRLGIFVLVAFSLLISSSAAHAFDITQITNDSLDLLPKALQFL